MQETRGFEQVVLTAAEARTRQIPLAKQRQPAAGPEPGESMNEARRVEIASIAPAATSTTSTSVPTAAAAAASVAAGARPVRVLDMDPDGPNAVTQDELISFILDRE